MRQVALSKKIMVWWRKVMLALETTMILFPVCHLVISLCQLPKEFTTTSATSHTP